MNFSSANRAKLPNIELTPLLDIAFILVIFLLVNLADPRFWHTLPIQPATVNSAISNSGQPDKAQILELWVDHHGNARWSHALVPSSDIQAIFNQIDPEIMQHHDLVVVADQRLTYQQMIQILGHPASSRFKSIKLQVAIEPSFSENRK